MVQLVNHMDVTLLLHLLCVKLVTLSEAMWDGISSQLMGQSVRPATLILEETYIRKVDPSPVLLLLSRFSRVRLCPTPDCSPPGSAIPGILQARTLEWVAISFSTDCQCSELNLCILTKISVACFTLFRSLPHL